MRRKHLIILMFAILFIGKVYSFWGMPWDSDERGALTMSERTNAISSGINYIALIIGLFLAFSSHKCKAIFSKFKITLFFIFLLLVFWVVLTIFQCGIVDTLYTPTSPFAYFAIFLLLLGGDDECWEALKQVSLFFAIINFLLSITYNIIAQPLLIINPSLSGNSPVMTFFVSGFWWLAACVIDLKKRNIGYRIAVINLIILVFFIAFSMTARSWMIQSILMFILVLSQTKISRKAICLLCSMFLGVGIVIHFSPDFSLIVSESYEKLVEKNETDTRSFQYREIFAQVELVEWISGGGMNATYKSETNGGDEYSYIDNQFIFAAFRYGILFMLLWFGIWFFAIVKSFRLRQYIHIDYGLTYVLMMWMFALGGLSVFNVIVLNQQTILMCYFLGRCLYNSINCHHKQ